MSKDLNIAGETVKAGQRLTINIPVARLYTHTAMTMPVHVLRGKRDGPRLFVCAAVHGDEIIGVEIIRRLLKLKVLKRLRGALLAVPVVNVYGFIHNSRHLPDRRDLNRFFPGLEKGSLTSRLADNFMKEIVANSTHGIDLHAGSNNRVNLPQIRACLDDPQTRALAVAFGAPVIIDSKLRNGSLRMAVKDQGIPMLLYEGGEAMRFDEVAIRAGVRGILAVMQNIGMLSTKAVRPSKIQPLVAGSTTWVRAPMSGILSTRVPLGGEVKENDTIGKIADPFGEHEVSVVSHASGIVIGRTNFPLIHRGDALFNIASFDDSVPLKEILDEFRDEFDENSQSGFYE